MAAKFIATAMAVIVLVGCESGNAPGTPGSLTANVHGRVASGVAVTR